MKRELSLVFLMFLIGFSNSIAYSQVKNTIVDTNSVWSVYHCPVVPNPPPATSNFIHLKGDTVIDSKRYTKIWENNDLYPTDSMRFCGFIREENKKTFYRADDEFIIYDFSLSIGDRIAFNNFWFTVIEIDSVAINGSKYKQMKLSNRYKTIALIEKIGNIEKGLFYTLSLGYVGSWEHLLCYFNKNNCLYTNPNFNYCSLSLDKTLDTDIYPNPVKDYLNIDSKEIISKLEVLDLKSKLLKSKDSINSFKFRINVSSLSTGDYILRITNKKNQIRVLKFSKQ